MIIAIVSAIMVGGFAKKPASPLCSSRQSVVANRRPSVSYQAGPARRSMKICLVCEQENVEEDFSIVFSTDYLRVQAILSTSMEKQSFLMA
jgi:hypothetical protein